LRAGPIIAYLVCWSQPNRGQWVGAVPFSIRAVGLSLLHTPPMAGRVRWCCNQRKSSVPESGAAEKMPSPPRKGKQSTHPGFFWPSCRSTLQSPCHARNPRFFGRRIPPACACSSRHGGKLPNPSASGNPGVISWAPFPYCLNVWPDRGPRAPPF